ncbi:Thioredoxin family protein [Histomonas meleagridis]|uniref:Thioredoxin family protein n=1 Tax=Histomonas meleagridis TaxID=135588 RepID=UPI00355A2497|nr:Thioredoxin family protein [Histomonas meleagridis]KAH0802484.1 Thioredoxin family protein [Histomonas meleagridis]
MKYKNSIDFIIAENSTKKSKKGYPLIQAYKNGNVIDQFDVFGSDIAFADWCRKLSYSDKSVITIYHPEELRLIFENSSTVLFGIDLQSPPKEYQNDLKYYQVSSYLFSFFNLSVVSGLYVYRGIDRQLIQATKNYHSYLKTPIVNPETTDLTKRPFFAGYFLTPYKKEANSEEMAVIRRLATEFPEDFYFSPLTGALSSLFAILSKLKFMSFPLFVVWNTTHFDEKRFIINDQNSLNFEYLKKFLTQIRNNEIEPTPVSEKVNPKVEMQLVRSNFASKLKSNSLVLFVGREDENTEEYMLILNYMRNILNNVHFFVYNVSVNDVPIDFDIDDNVPMFVYFADVKAPVFLRTSSITVEKLVGFVVDNSNSAVKRPSADLERIQDDVRKEMRDRRTKRQLNQYVDDEL